MAGKVKYKTKQMSEVLSFLKSAKGRHVTAGEVCEHFRAAGISVGTTTVYRNLERLVEQGLAAKYVIDGTTSACFEYTGGSNTDSGVSCYHCKCEKCGKLIHLQCDEVDTLIRHMREHHDFEMDSIRTVFYGICSVCREKRNEITQKY